MCVCIYVYTHIVYTLNVYIDSYQAATISNYNETDAEKGGNKTATYIATELMTC